MKSILVSSLLSLPVVLSGLFFCQKVVAEQVDVRLTLPAQIYAVPGEEMCVYFANTILAENTQEYLFDIECEIGELEQARWKVKPTPEEVGRYEVTLTVSNSSGEQIEQAESSLVVSPANAGEQMHLRLLLVGDSLTQASIYPNKIAALLEGAGNPSFAMIGTHKPSSCATNVAHEGYGGWTWQRFVEHYEPNPDGTYRKKSSPFVFLTQEGNKELNVGRYIDEQYTGTPPNVVVFKLGINDCFHVDPGNVETIDRKIDAVFNYADRLVEEFKDVIPPVTVGICLTTPGNARDSAFSDNYGDRYTRWGWKRIQHRLVQRQIQHFEDEKQKTYLLFLRSSVSIRWQDILTITQCIRMQRDTSRLARPSMLG